MFTTSRFSICSRLLYPYHRINKISSILLSSSLIKLDLTMKELINLKQYQKALDLFEQLKSSTDVTINLALKACTKSNNYEYGLKIREQLSPKSLNNPFIQTSLIHFYSKSLISESNYHRK